MLEDKSLVPEKAMHSCQSKPGRVSWCEPSMLQALQSLCICTQACQPKIQVIMYPVDLLEVTG